MRASICPCFSFRGVVLGVLSQVAVLARHTDLFRDPRAFHRGEVLVFLRQRLVPFGRHRIAVHTGSPKLSHGNASAARVPHCFYARLESRAPRRATRAAKTW